MSVSPPGGILLPIGAAPWTTKQRYVLRGHVTTIGRGRDCDVRLPIRTISRVHAELRWEGKRLVLEHRSTTNATVVNNYPVSNRIELRSGDVIEISDSVAFRVELFGEGEDATTEVQALASRRMQAVLVSDVAGYSRMMEESEADTVDQFNTCLRLFEHEIARADGRVVNVAGDSVLATFGNLAGGLQCAISIQRKTRELNQALLDSRRMWFRMGFNGGEVIIDAVSGLHGDTVNIAARLEQLAPPGEIYVSGSTVDQIHEVEPGILRFVRTEKLKNISRLVQIYQVVVER